MTYHYKTKIMEKETKLSKYCSIGIKVCNGFMIACIIVFISLMILSGLWKFILHIKESLLL